jgi:hypothetical protein
MKFTSPEIKLVQVNSKPAKFNSKIRKLHYASTYIVF